MARIARSAALAAALLPLVSATAHAEVTAATVQSPAANAAVVAVAGTPVTFSGTSDGAPGDAIDVRCWDPSAHFPVVTWVASGTVGDGGAWEATVDGADVPAGFCDLRAVPSSFWHGSDDPAPYPPLRVSFAAKAAPYTGDDPLLTDLTVFGLGTAGYELGALGSCGLCRTAMIADASIGQMGEQLWAGVGVLPGLEQETDVLRAGAQVDGERAYAPSSLSSSGSVLVPGPWGLAALTGMRSIAWTTSRAPDGTRTSVETQELLRCTADPDALDPEGCGDLAPAGVQVRRTVTVDPTGTEVDVADRWRSTDGAAHALDLDWRHTLAPSTPRIKRAWDAEGFGATQSPRTVPGPGGGATAATIFAAGQPSPSATWPQGAIVMAPVPVDLRFLEGTVVSSMSNRFAARQQITVPAGGAVTTRQVFLVGATRSAVQSAAAAAEARIGQPEAEPQVPELQSPPAISGTARVGSHLGLMTRGRWSRGPTDFDFQWLRCASEGGGACVPIDGATGRLHKLAAGDAGHRLRVQVIAANADGASQPARSAESAVVAARTARLR